MPTDPVFNCPRCGYETSRKSNLLQHYQRRIPCPPEKEDIPFKDLLSQFLEEREQIYAQKTFVCSKCEAGFTTPQALSRHRLHYCKGGTHTETEISMTQILEKLEKLEKQVIATRVADNMMPVIQNFVNDIKDREATPQMLCDLKKQICHIMINNSDLKSQ